MASSCLTGAVCAGLLAFVSTTVHAQELAVVTPVAAVATADAATVWRLRSALNVAALACRGADEQAIVAGYNRLLADHRSELATVYERVSHGFGNAAAFDAAMTNTYNGFAQPAAQVALCANAVGVLDSMTAHSDRPLGEIAATALARLQGRGQVPLVATQVAVAAIPHVLDERAASGPLGAAMKDEDASGDE